MDVSWNWKEYSRFDRTSLMIVLSMPYSFKDFLDVSPHFYREPGLMVPKRWGSMTFSSLPFFFQCIAHFAILNCSLGRTWLRVGLTHKSSSNTTPKEYTSCFSTSCHILKYSGSRYPKLPLIVVLTWVFEYPNYNTFSCDPIIVEISDI